MLIYRFIVNRRNPLQPLTDNFKKHFIDIVIIAVNIKKIILEIKAKNIKRAIKRYKGEYRKIIKKYLEI